VKDAQGKPLDKPQDLDLMKELRVSIVEISEETLADFSSDLEEKDLFLD